jgi:hypothetical protein
VRTLPEETEQHREWGETEICQAIRDAARLGIPVERVIGERPPRPVRHGSVRKPAAGVAVPVDPVHAGDLPVPPGTVQDPAAAPS